MILIYFELQEDYYVVTPIERCFFRAIKSYQVDFSLSLVISILSFLDDCFLKSVTYIDQKW